MIATSNMCQCECLMSIAAAEMSNNKKKIKINSAILSQNVENSYLPVKFHKCS